ncbi:Oidioi.mRNA.OKI2018_I69.chr2.g4495.t1.cds [Oikopleura dioica]|uniref:Oidioi.mRNA.OKI2018_I69.chr2.g4495.t1.cds n=1 Tax=Oikopleura dioica TaxID=34765 RepID=A0ABN7T2Z3_OIKDI|nr:Oidioi.mRNA.OKI2018_I69.chr2.g4495.t1.cds [Oikopleura dioica]
MEFKKQWARIQQAYTSGPLKVYVSNPFHDAAKYQLKNFYYQDFSPQTTTTSTTTTTTTTTTTFYDSWDNITMPLHTCNYDSIHISSNGDYDAYDWTGEYHKIPHQNGTYPKTLTISTYDGYAHSGFRFQTFVAKYHSTVDWGNPEFCWDSHVLGIPSYESIFNDRNFIYPV